jgi:hypothetical protein
MEDMLEPQEFKVTVISFYPFDKNRRRHYFVTFYFRFPRNYSMEEKYKKIRESYGEIEEKIRKRFAHSVIVEKIERTGGYKKPEKSEIIHQDFIIDILD